MEQMARNGDIDLTEERTLEKSLHCMPIETLLDFKQLTGEDVSGRLKAVHVAETSEITRFHMRSSSTRH